MAVTEDFGAVAYGEGGASAAGGCFIVLDEFGDGWLGCQRSVVGGCGSGDILPIFSTMPVNILAMGVVGEGLSRVVMKLV